jgi:acetolactate synthase-1/2/3 large subunit
MASPKRSANGDARGASGPGKTAIREDHLLSVGNTGFWGSIAANKVANQADVILAVGTRFAEIDCSFWDPKFTFAIPPAS